MKVYINTRYVKEEEVRTDIKPYNDYGDCIFLTFSNEQINSFCDIGCATGHLMKYLKDRGLKVKGYEYFEYHKNSELCPTDIRDNITIFDIRDPLSEDIEKYDIVNCTEVGEHIDPEYADILIQNCKKLSNKYIIFTWSSHGGINEPHCDPNHQHLNPLSSEKYIKLMKKHNLTEDAELTEKFLSYSYTKENFYSWWRESFVIWKI